MKIKKVVICKTCKKIYPNGIVEICKCGTVLGEKIPKSERLNTLYYPGATITFNPSSFEGYEEGVLRMTENCEEKVARKRFLKKWEIVD